MLVGAGSAEAQWERRGGWEGRRCPGGACYDRRAPRRPPWAGNRGASQGKVCYNIVGRPYLYRGGGRCPMS